MKISKERIDILNQFPGGICIYRLMDGQFSPCYHNLAFFDIMGYSEEHCEQVQNKMTFLGVHEDDLRVALEEQEALINGGRSLNHTCRIFHDKRGEYRWIHVNATVVEEDDETYLYALFSDVSDQKMLEAQMEDAREKLNHVVNSIPGGIASYRFDGGSLKAAVLSEGVIALSGYSRAEYEELIREDVMNMIYEPDRSRVYAVACHIAESRKDAQISCRVQQKNGCIVWLHMHGRYAGTVDGEAELFVVFTGMSAETKLFQSIVNDIGDSIFVVDKNTYDLLYVNEKENIFAAGNCLGRKCYEALHGKDKPCEFCTFHKKAADGKEHRMLIGDSTRSYLTRFHEMNWNGIPAYVKYVRDVTEEEMTRREKKRLEQYFHTLLQNLPGGVTVVRWEKSGFLIPEYLSEGFAAMAGMSLEEAWEMYNGDSWAGVHPDDVERVEKVLLSCVTGEESNNVVYRMKCGDGNYIWVKCHLSLMKNDQGEIRVYAVYYDITEERKKQNRLRQDYQNTILQHYQMPDTNALLLGHCNITRGKILEVFDYTGINLRQRFGDELDSFFRGLSEFIVDKKERDEFLNLFLEKYALKAFERGEREKHIVCYQLLPGKETGQYVKYKMGMVANPDNGEVAGVLTVTDVTQHIMESRIFQQISESGYDFVADVDLIRDRYKILSKNGDYEETPPIHGGHQQWISYMSRSVVIPEDREQYLENLASEFILEKIKKGETYCFTFSMRNKEGKVLTKSATVRPVDKRLGRACLVRSDITQILEEERRSKRRMEEALTFAEEANQAKSRFLSSMSHDIRTPLNAIIGMTALTRAHLDEPGRVDEYLEKISSASNHLLSLVNDVLDMSKIEHSRITLNQRDISITELLEQLNDMIESQAQTAGVKYHFHMGEIRHDRIWADSLRINQILLNVLGNAVKFTPRQGTVEFVVQEIAPQRFSSGARFHFIIRDSGIGMREEFLERIFEPFARGVGTEEIEGTGLGLSLTKGLVDLLHGEITVESKLGFGTTFNVILEFDSSRKLDKVEGKQPLVSGEISKEESPLKGYHFLVVEDNMINAEILVELLQLQGGSCVHKADGRQAVKEFCEAAPGTYDAVLMDIQMPEMDGYTATRMIRGLDRPDASQIPIITMTANAFTEDIEAALVAGMNAHLSKPIDIDVLTDTLKQWLKPNAHK